VSPPINDGRLFDLSHSFTDSEIKALVGMFPRAGKVNIVDERKHLAELADIPSETLAFGHQIHSSIVNVVETRGYAGEGDGLITKTAEVVLTVQVADCVPLFIHSRDSCTLGLFHAGWRGALAGIIEEGISLMASQCDAVPSKMEAVLGPSIGPCCYKIRGDVSTYFPDLFLRKKNREHSFLDLPGFVKEKLMSAGITADNIFMDGRCTFCSEEHFHSFRRDGDAAGRIICFLGRM
jgi:YfiH family protein